MELATIIGMVLGFLTITVGMVLKGSSVAALINPAAIVIIFVGTAASLFNGFAMDDLKKFPILLKLLFKKQELIAKGELLRLFVELSQTARREGILALEGRMEELSDPFLRNGISMIVDGLDAEFVGDVLEADVQAMEERHRSGALIFSQAGTYAPTLGVLGAVIGLIAALGNLDDIEKLGHSIAAAFVATLLGIFSGYVLWHPFANKLKNMSKHEAER
ncbi:MAG: pomA, partial [Anaerospora sp.]|nr:pomA [Anaerospora sp.]